MLRRAPSSGWIAAAIPALLLVSNIAAAQPKPPAPKAPAPKPAAAAPAQPPVPAAPSQAAPPAPIAVDDPLLTPVSAPAHQINSWKEALDIINARSIDLATATQEVLKAEGVARQALAAALPTINATGTVTHQILYDPAPAFSAFVNRTAVQGQLTASIPILAPRAWYNIKTAEMSVSSAKLTAEDKRRTVLVGVANAIVAVFTAERVAEINRVSLRSSLERLDLTKRKFRLGDGTQLDVLRAEQDASTTRGTLVTGDESLRQSREALGLALGFHESYGVPNTISLNEIEAAVHNICAAGKLDERPDIQQAKNDIEIAKRGITDAWLAFSPTATLSTTLAVANQTSNVTQGPATWSLQALLNIPLWEGGARYGTLKIARANAEEAKLKFEATIRSANIDVAQALRSVSVAEQSRQVSEQSRDVARESARLAQRAYEVGTGTSFDLVDTAQKARAAELDLAVKEFQVIKARLAALLAASSCKY
ncbi:RND efflux system, outer membrane lipoprotein CmeC [Minicystis rosea]|nr:RND efflux system, outer membrane lipoprotein CmeC [Minicystis rosea]